MNAVRHQGPVQGPALVVREGAETRIPVRRHIGSGAREIILTRPVRTAPRRVAARPVERPAPVKRPTLYVTSFLALLLTSITAVGIGASVDTPRTLMSPADYAAGKRAIETQSRTALGRCRGLPVAQKEVCRAEVRADERVQKADLVARYHGTFAAAQEAREARVKASYDVARAKCGGAPAESRMACLHAAREERNRRIAEGGASTT